MFNFPLPSIPPEKHDLDWYFQNEIAIPPEGAIGFVYCITNKVSGKRYIGKKLCRFTRTKQKTVTLKNGTKKKKKIKEYSESDWRTYYGSNEYLANDVQELGEGNFYREVLVWCNSTGEMTYIESYYQFTLNVLLYPDLWYNGWIMCRASRSHIKRLIESD